MKEKLKRLFASLAAVVMAVAMMAGSAIPAMAATSHSITITNTNSAISISGKTYTAYKLFDSTQNADKSAYAYTLSTSSPFYDSTLTTANSSDEDNNPTTMVQVLRKYFTFTAIASDNTKLTVTPRTGFDSDAARAFADAIQKYIDPDNNWSSNYATYVKSGTVADNAETVTINLADDAAGLGYYLVTGGASSKDPEASDKEIDSAVIITNEDPDANINPKANVPTLDKKITSDSNYSLLDNDGKEASAAIGTTVNFQIDSTVPDLTGYSDYTFKISDTMSSGLSFTGTDTENQINGLKVYIKTMDNESDALDGTTTGQVYSVAHTVGDKTFTVTIPYATLSASGYKAGDTIRVTYSAIVNEGALSTNYEKNTAQLEYSNSPYTTTETNKTPEKTVYVVDVNIDVHKYSDTSSATTVAKTTYTDDSAAWTAGYIKNTASEATDETYWIKVDKVQGAEFQIFKGSTQPQATANSWYKYDEDNDKVTWVAKTDADTFTTDSNGQLVNKTDNNKKPVRGLEASKDGTSYGILETAVPAGYNLLAAPVIVTVKATYANNSGAETVTITSDGNLVQNGTINLAAASTTDPESKQPTVSSLIKNSKGTVLPSTGGIGTTIFYVIGGILVAGAVVILVARKRRNA